MVVKRCVYGTCMSDNRKDKTIRFIAFPKPKMSLGKCVRWIHLCGRENLSIEKVTPYTFICEKHFPSGAELNPHINPDLEPFSAHAEEESQRPPLAPLSLNAPLPKPLPKPRPPNLAQIATAKFSKKVLKKNSVLVFDKSTQTYPYEEPVLTLDCKFYIIL
jgi:hypothetical protein